LKVEMAARYLPEDLPVEKRMVFMMRAEQAASVLSADALKEYVMLLVKITKEMPDGLSAEQQRMFMLRVEKRLQGESKSEIRIEVPADFSVQQQMVFEKMLYGMTIDQQQLFLIKVQEMPDATEEQATYAQMLQITFACMPAELSYKQMILFTLQMKQMPSGLSIAEQEAYALKLQMVFQIMPAGLSAGEQEQYVLRMVTVFDQMPPGLSIAQQQLFLLRVRAMPLDLSTEEQAFYIEKLKLSFTRMPEGLSAELRMVFMLRMMDMQSGLSAPQQEEYIRTLIQMLMALSDEGTQQRNSPFSATQQRLGKRSGDCFGVEAMPTVAYDVADAVNNRRSQRLCTVWDNFSTLWG